MLPCFSCQFTYFYDLGLGILLQKTNKIGLEIKKCGNSEWFRTIITVRVLCLHHYPRVYERKIQYILKTQYINNRHIRLKKYKNHLNNVARVHHSLLVNAHCTHFQSCGIDG
jgi:abortive infection bacteriophage resistance protein